MRALVTGFSACEASRQGRAMAFGTQLPYVLNVTLLSGIPGLAGDIFRLLKVFLSDGNEAQDSAAFVGAVGQTRWTVRCINAAWMLSTGLSETAYAIWNRLDSHIQPSDNLNLDSQRDQQTGEP
jgi:hypothetical protein